MLFQLYNCVVPVKGVVRSTLCDMQRQKFTFVPNAFIELIGNRMFLDITTTKNRLSDSSEHLVLDELLGSLVEKEYGFYTEKIDKAFKRFDNSITDYTLTNAIIDIALHSEFCFRTAILKLNKLFIKHLKIRFFEIDCINKLDTILDDLDDSTFRSVEILFGNTYGLSHDSIIDKIIKRSRVNRIIFSHKNGAPVIQTEKGELRIIYVSADLTSPTCCGNISAEYFKFNENLYRISSNYNSCLFGKISINSQGFVQNCPSMKATFGRIEDADLTSIMQSKIFKEVGLINKKLIDVCKTCEFRLMCPDCRAYTFADKIYGKPLKCSYDPSRGKWASVGEDSKN